MGIFIKGDIVVLNFPFSDLSGAKRRPALVLTDLEGDDIILCQITSRTKSDKYTVSIETEDYASGRLISESFIRTNKIFTADKGMIQYKACSITNEKFEIVVKMIISQLTLVKTDMRGQIILLNGVSSSGKTTIAKNLQKKLPEPFFLLGNDIFTDEMAPEKFKETDWQELEYQSLAMMIKTIRLFSDEGKNVIADCVFLTVQKNDLLRECVDLLHEYPLLFVHVECRSAEDLSAREKKRGDRDIGQGASQLALLNPQDTYDLTVDTVKKTADECADRIIQMIERKNKSEAFHELFGNYVNER